jgi:hypothetical protein
MTIPGYAQVKSNLNYLKIRTEGIVDGFKELPGKAIEHGVPALEKHCVNLTNATVKFLDEHPGISMALSPSTVLRRAAQKHVDNLTQHQVKNDPA